MGECVVTSKLTDVIMNKQLFTRGPLKRKVPPCYMNETLVRRNDCLSARAGEGKRPCLPLQLPLQALPQHPPPSWGIPVRRSPTACELFFSFILF